MQILKVAMAATCGTAIGASKAARQTSTAPVPTAQRPAARPNMAETDLGVSLYRTFTSSTSGNSTLQKPANGTGAMVEFRHIQCPLVGYEVSYGFNRANQSLAPAPGACGFNCDNPPVTLTVVRIMYTYGGGVDVGLLPRTGVRLQYRGNLYKAPDIDEDYGATDKFTQTGEAEVGFYFHL